VTIRTTLLERGARARLASVHGAHVATYRVLLATGGTGGHIFPALALARSLRQEGHEVLVLGGRGGMEAVLAAKADLPFYGVATGKFDRDRLDPRAPFRALWGTLEAAAHVRRWRPDVAVGFGGFASFPGCAAALVNRVPLVLHETNAVPGLVTRWFARFAVLVFACQEETAAALPGVRVRCLPFPVREVRVPRSEARRALGIPQGALMTLVMGGSQGSLALNEAVPRAFRRLPRAAEHWLLHASGPAWVDDVRAAYEGETRVVVSPFVDATLAWSAADLAVTRGGFGTLAEAAYHGVPLVVVPLPSAADDHQRANALALERAGAGRCVDQGDDDALVEAWSALLADDDARDEAARAMRGRSPRGGTSALHHAILPIAAGTRTNR
jgi:UDP-N-acetylglucosamine--N-acetylmuramyl-(pentapeptide) pyrophosphoryl-undecaprenol N-acetylglucosamine transferase